MTVQELGERMTWLEYLHWAALLTIVEPAEREEAKAQMNL